MPDEAGSDERATSKFACLCCGNLTLSAAPPGTDALCEVCYWEDDRVQGEDPDAEEGANVVSLTRARENFRTFGAAELQWVDRVRPPRPDEIPPGDKAAS